MTTQKRRKELKDKYDDWEKRLNDRFERRLAGLKAHYERMQQDIKDHWRQQLESMHAARTEELAKLDGHKPRTQSKENNCETATP